jgi:glucose/arabinose dehydrogenase
MKEESNISFALAADGLCFPTSVTFDDAGGIYVAESGLSFDGAPPGGRIIRIREKRERTVIANSLRAPVNGVVFHKGALYVSEGGHPGRISRFTLDGHRTTILDNLPGPGNYHTNMVAFGPDGKLYFSQGAMTNTGIVGLDAYEIGWLRRLPHAHDLPGIDIRLAGVNVETTDPLNNGGRTRTGAFVPFGTATAPDLKIRARLPCTASIMRCNPDGSGLELVAWGLRNAYGLGFLPDGRLLAVDQGADDRGSRPVGNSPDFLFEVRQGGWYGWPDFIGGQPITGAQFCPERGPQPTFLLANHNELPSPEPPLMRFPAHVAAVKFDVAPPDWPEWGGHIYIALFGDERPMTAPRGPRAGRAVAYIDQEDWTLRTLHTDFLQRPIDVRFNRCEGLWYVLDFGQFEMAAEQGVIAKAYSGKLWRWRKKCN